MKNLVVVFLVVVLFSGCQMIWEIQDEYNIQQIGTHELYFQDEFLKLTTFDSITRYVQQHLTYSEEASNDPKTILKEGKANCMGYSILFANIAYFSMNIEVDIVAVDLDDSSRAIINGGFPNHAVCYYKDVYIDPQQRDNTGTPTFTTRYRYEFHEFLY